MTPLWMMILGPCAAIALAVGAILLVTALMGQRRGTRPQCRACRAPLRGHVSLPESCPSCTAPLTARGAVRFGGYRFRGRMLLVALALLGFSLLPVAIERYTAAATPAMAGFGAIPIERRPSEARFAQATANGDEGAWLWIRAHLDAGELSDALKRQAATLLIDSTRDGVIGEDIERASELLHDFIDHRAYAEALLAVVPEPTMVAERMRSGSIRVTWSWDDEQAVSRGPGLLFQRVHAVVASRVDGVSRRPGSPTGRWRTMPWSISVFLPVQPQDSSVPPQTVTIELVFAVIDDPDEAIFSGPPETWPGVTAHRRVTIEVPVTAGP